MVNLDPHWLRKFGEALEPRRVKQQRQNPENGPYFLFSGRSGNSNPQRLAPSAPGNPSFRLCPQNSRFQCVISPESPDHPPTPPYPQNLCSRKSVTWGPMISQNRLRHTDFKNLKQKPATTARECCAAEIEKLVYPGLNSCLPDLFHSICNSPKSFHDSRIDGGNFDHLWLKKLWFSAHGAIWLYGSAHNVERNAVVTLKTFLRVAKYIKLIRFQQIIDWFGQCFYLGCTTPPAKGCRFLEKI